MTFTYEAIRSSWRIIFCLETVTVKEKRRGGKVNQGNEEDEGTKGVGQDLLNNPEFRG